MNWIRHDCRYSLSHQAVGFLLAICFSAPLMAQVELNYQNNETVTWQEAIDMYQWLDEQYEDARLLEIGQTDAGRPLHLFVIDRGRYFSPEQIRESGKNILFINNGIHPGEPCGVDASLKLACDLLSGEDSCARYLDNTVVVIVPILNVGGALMRGSFHRANQNGPKEHGFRGNARNLDLNRDFIKLDSKNTRFLVPQLRSWEPDIFVDTHTSNGADYPYTLTLINSHSQRHETSHPCALSFQRLGGFPLPDEPLCLEYQTVARQRHSCIYGLSQVYLGLRQYVQYPCLHCGDTYVQSI